MWTGVKVSALCACIAASVAQDAVQCGEGTGLNPETNMCEIGFVNPVREIRVGTAPLSRLPFRRRAGGALSRRWGQRRGFGH